MVRQAYARDIGTEVPKEVCVLTGGEHSKKNIDKYKGPERQVCARTF